MSEDVEFIDLAALLKITENTTIERFGSYINASIFDASNIAGTLKKKGLIDFTTYYPGPNAIVITDAGKNFIAEADAKAAEPFDALDEAVLEQLSRGSKLPAELQSALNIRPRDMALRLYKVFKQGFIIYELKSGGLQLMLTEQGFLKAGEAKKAAAEPEKAEAAQATEPQKQEAPAQQNTDGEQLGKMADDLSSGKKTGKKGGWLIYIVILLLVIVVVEELLYYFKVISI